MREQRNVHLQEILLSALQNDVGESWKCFPWQDTPPPNLVVHWSMRLNDLVGDGQKDRSVKYYADVDGKVKNGMDANVLEIMSAWNERYFRAENDCGFR
jgi:hypothetical protein